jgi:hypothetical protein
MSNFVTELFWEDAKEPVVAPAHPHDRERDRKPLAPASAEKQSDRLQRVAGNAALAHEAEEAESKRKRLAEAARQPEKTLEKTPAPQAAARPDKKTEKLQTKTPAGFKSAKTTAAQAAVTAEAQRLPETTKAAAARADALAQVLVSFETDAGRAELLALARLAESAPPGIADETARVIALAVMRAGPEQRSAIAARIKTELGDRHDLRLARLMADRLAWLVVVPHAAPPPPPPPPAPPG